MLCVLAEGVSGASLPLPLSPPCPAAIMHAHDPPPARLAANQRGNRGWKEVPLPAEPCRGAQSQSGTDDRLAGSRSNCHPRAGARLGVIGLGIAGGNSGGEAEAEDRG